MVFGEKGTYKATGEAEAYDAQIKSLFFYRFHNRFGDGPVKCPSFFIPFEYIDPGNIQMAQYNCTKCRSQHYIHMLCISCHFCSRSVFSIWLQYSCLT